MTAQTTHEPSEPDIEDRSMRVAEYLLAIIAALAAVILTVVR